MRFTYVTYQMGEKGNKALCFCLRTQLITLISYTDKLTTPYSSYYCTYERQDQERNEHEENLKIPVFKTITQIASHWNHHHRQQTITHLFIGDMVHVRPLKRNLGSIPHQFGVMASVDDKTINPLSIFQLCAAEKYLVCIQWLSTARGCNGNASAPSGSKY